MATLPVIDWNTYKDKYAHVYIEYFEAYIDIYMYKFTSYEIIFISL